MDKLLEVGKIVNTHGLKGEIKILHWCDSPEFLLEFDTVYLEGKIPLNIKTARVHKKSVLMTFEGINDINEAEKYKNKIIYINRDDAEIDENQVFHQDIIGINVFDQYLNKEIGVVKDILEMPTYDMFVIQGDKKEHLVPDVEKFIKEIDIDKKLMTICTIEGMIEDEN